MTVTTNVPTFTAEMVGSLLYAEEKELRSVKPWVAAEKGAAGRTSSERPEGLPLRKCPRGDRPGRDAVLRAARAPRTTAAARSTARRT